MTSPLVGSGAQCQRADWTQHKAECAALAGSCTSHNGRHSEQFSLRDACRLAGLGEDDILRDTRLVLRLTVSVVSPHAPGVGSDHCKVAADRGQRADSGVRDVHIQCGAAHVMTMCSNGKAGGAATHSIVEQFVTQILSKVFSSFLTLHADWQLNAGDL